MNTAANGESSLIPLVNAQPKIKGKRKFVAGFETRDCALMGHDRMRILKSNRNKPASERLAICIVYSLLLTCFPFCRFALGDEAECRKQYEENKAAEEKDHKDFRENIKKVTPTAYLRESLRDEDKRHEEAVSNLSVTLSECLEEAAKEKRDAVAAEAQSRQLSPEQINSDNFQATVFNDVWRAWGVKKPWTIPGGDPEMTGVAAANVNGLRKLATDTAGFIHELGSDIDKLLNGTPTQSQRAAGAVRRVGRGAYAELNLTKR